MIDTRRWARRFASWSPSILIGDRHRRGRRLVSFVAIGAVCTVAFILLYSLVRTAAGPLTANLVALSLTMTVNFSANRRYTFEATGGALPVQGVQYAAVYLLGLGASTGVLHTSLNLVSEPGRVIETMIAVGAGAVATGIRFLLLSAWVFRQRVPNVRGPELT